MKRTNKKYYSNKTGLALLGLAVLPFTANLLPPEMISPCVGDCTYQVYASEVVEQVVSEVTASEASYSTASGTVSIKMLADKPVEKNNKSEVEAYIHEVFGENGSDAVKVAKCESGLRKDAINDKNRNKTVDYGVFQINSVHIKTRGKEFTVDWKANVRTAKKIFDEQGFRPWVCAKAAGHTNYLGHN